MRWYYFALLKHALRVKKVDNRFYIVEQDHLKIVQLIVSLLSPTNFLISGSDITNVGEKTEPFQLEGSLFSRIDCAPSVTVIKPEVSGRRKYFLGPGNESYFLKTLSLRL